MSNPADFPKGKTDAEWQKELTSNQYYILRKKGTEPAGSGEYDGHYPAKGTYDCAACHTPLYTAESKFKSGCGWPAYDEAIAGAVTEITDSSFGMARTEIICKNCGGHLGHVFRGERLTPKNERACVNSVSIKYNANGGTGAGESKAKA